MNIVYIAGYGRSGSSILSRLIGQDPRFLSLGELGRLPEFVRADQQCVCGEPLSGCPFWGPIRGSRTLLGSASQQLQAIWDHVSANGPEDFLIDSSKTAYRGFLRPVSYLRARQRVYFIHLVRDPDQVVASTLKGRNRDLAKGNAKPRSGETIRTLLGWTYANFVASVYRLALGKRALLLRYEDVLSDPVGALRKVGGLVGADFGDTIALLEQDRPLVRGHEIAGNRVLRAKAETLRRSPERARQPAGMGWRLFANIMRPIGGR